MSEIYKLLNEKYTSLKDTIIIFSQGEMDIDEDQLECGVLPIRIPLAFHDRFIEEDGEEIISVKCKSKVKC